MKYWRLDLSFKKHFQKVMKCEHIPLLSDFNVYSRSLPVRESYEEVIPLYTLPYWTNDEDLEGFADQLEARPTVERRHVKYICAPSGYGKSACILPGFLKSAEREGGFTHYLYMAFANNNGNNFRSEGFAKVADPIYFFEKQGAIFILKCLEILLESPGKKGTHYIQLNHSSRFFTNVTDKLGNTLRNIKRPDQQRLRILLHLDEHCKMCHREEPDDDNVCSGANFSKGALEDWPNSPPW